MCQKLQSGLMFIVIVNIHHLINPAIDELLEDRCTYVPEVSQPTYTPMSITRWNANLHDLIVIIQSYGES